MGIRQIRCEDGWMAKILRGGPVDRDGSLAACDPVGKRLKSRQWAEEMLAGSGKLYVLNTIQVSVPQSLCVSIWASAGERWYPRRDLHSDDTLRTGAWWNRLRERRRLTVSPPNTPNNYFSAMYFTEDSHGVLGVTQPGSVRAKL